MEKTVPTFVSVRTERTVTTSLASARAGLDLQANNVSKVSSKMTSFFCFSGVLVHFRIDCRNRLLNEVLMAARQNPWHLIESRGRGRPLWKAGWSVEASIPSLKLGEIEVSHCTQC